MTSYTLPMPAVTAFKRALTQIEQRRSALTVIPAPIVRYQRPKTLVEQIADACYVIAVTIAVLVVVTLLTLFLLSALTLEVSRTARRYWYEHNLTQRGLSALLMTGVYGTARVVNLYPVARAAVTELNSQVIESYRPALTVTVQFCDRLPVARCLSHPESPTLPRGASFCLSVVNRCLKIQHVARHHRPARTAHHPGRSLRPYGRSGSRLDISTHAKSGHKRTQPKSCRLQPTKCTKKPPLIVAVVVS